MPRELIARVEAQDGSNELTETTNVKLVSMSQLLSSFDCGRETAAHQMLRMSGALPCPRRNKHRSFWSIVAMRRTAFLLTSVWSRRNP